MPSQFTTSVQKGPDDYEKAVQPACQPESRDPHTMIRPFQQELEVRMLKAPLNCDTTKLRGLKDRAASR